MHSRVIDTGLTVVYEPESGPVIVDVVFVHGLQGHPYKTWTTVNSHDPVGSAVEAPSLASHAKGGRKRLAIRRVAPFLSKRSSKKEGSKSRKDSKGLEPDDAIDEAPHPVFWPADLLPQECPRARILVYGYDTRVTKYMTGATNKNNIFSHSGDLLYAVGRERPSGRRLMFVAHSLGGVIVKEMLAQSSGAAEDHLKNIVESTAAVIFLGTPHRGSRELANMGDRMRSLASHLGMDTTAALLDALALKTTDLERAQDAFSGLWRKYDFRVKTFQEGLGLTGVGIGILGEKVVPDYSSVIGDQRERAETIQANHMEMCRFTGSNDPNYRKVAGEIRSTCNSIAELNSLYLVRAIPDATNLTVAAASGVDNRGTKLSGMEIAYLETLWYPSMHNRRQSLDSPAEDTCAWLFKHESYRSWIEGDGRDSLLWLKGKPGSGKSTLMKEAFRRVSSPSHSSPDRNVAAFFFNARGERLDHSPEGLFRSLLHQLLLRDRDRLRSFMKIWAERNLKWVTCDAKFEPWHEAELRSSFYTLFVQPSGKKTVIFIDALDECNPRNMWSPTMAYFLRNLTATAEKVGADLKVCLASRHFPNITLSDCPEITIEQHNSLDIAIYVEQRFRLGMAGKEPQWGILRDEILRKSAGVFLWVVLVVDKMLRRWEEGKSLAYVLKELDGVPAALGALFTQMLTSLDPDSVQLKLRFFQWVILAATPLRLHEWRHILAFISHPAPTSISEWHTGDDFIENDDQLERQIRTISLGLVEVETRSEDIHPLGEGFEMMSIRAGAGSLNLEAGESRFVQIIHESVREFFLTGPGFTYLYKTPPLNAIGQGHISIMETCLDYLNIAELDSLVQARTGYLSGPEMSVKDPTGPVRKSTETAMPRASSPPLVLQQPPAAEWSLQIPEHSPDGDDRTLEKSQDADVGQAPMALPGRVSHLEILEWIATHQSVCGQTSSGGSTKSSTEYTSVSGGSRVLEHFPSLLSYATYKLFAHARRAQASQGDPRPIVTRFCQEKGTWDRFVALREDIPHRTTLYEFAVVQELNTWVKIMENMKLPERGTLNKSQISPVYLDLHRRRRDSIASFSSASSHSDSEDESVLLRKTK